MKYHNITTADMLNGDGLRVVLWTAGCAHHCKNCQNPCTWDPNDGLEFDEAAKQEIFDALDKDYTDGITFSGGDPLHPANIGTVTALAKEIKTKYPDKTIWLYTGSTWMEVLEEVKHNPEAEGLLEYIGVLVDGEFVEELKDANLMWKGSSNQKVIDVQKTMTQENVLIPVLHCPDYEGNKQPFHIQVEPDCCGK